MIRLCLATALAVALSPAAVLAASVQPLERAHAHNDYEHANPLFDALDNGFTSVEADIFLVGGELLVAHDAVDLDPARSLKSLYLDPLRDRVAANGGSVYDEPASFRLLIDVKTEAESTWSALRDVLADYSDIFSGHAASGPIDGPVQAIVSGNRARDTMMAETTRYGFYDGRIPDDLGGDDSFVPLVSQNWNSLFSWQGVGAMPDDQRALLDQIVGTAHANGQIVRFWATPDAPGAARENLWSTLIDADVDLINTDDLHGLRSFLLENDPQEMPAPVPLPAGLLLLPAGLGLLGALRARRR